jgi:hypothetical protein
MNQPGRRGPRGVATPGPEVSLDPGDIDIGHHLVLGLQQIARADLARIMWQRATFWIDQVVAVRRVSLLRGDDLIEFRLGLLVSLLRIRIESWIERLNGLGIFRRVLALIFLGRREPPIGLFSLKSRPTSTPASCATSSRRRPGTRR